MLKHYKLRFTEDRKTFKTMVVPANSLTDAYIAIQTHFPNAEITEQNEDKSWVDAISKYLIDNASVAEVSKFLSYLDADKGEELINAIWDEWHKPQEAGAV